MLCFIWNYLFFFNIPYWWIFNISYHLMLLMNGYYLIVIKYDYRNAMLWIRQKIVTPCHTRLGTLLCFKAVYIISCKAILRVIALCSKPALSSVTIKVLTVKELSFLPLNITFLFIFVLKLSWKTHFRVWNKPPILLQKWAIYI